MADYRIRIFVDPSGAVAGSQRAEKAIERVGAAVDKVKERSVPGLMSKLGGLGGAIKTAAIFTAITAYMRMSDAVSTANAQLRLATQSQAQLVRAQTDAYNIAQKQGVSYTAMATLLAKTTKAATAMGNEMSRAQTLGANASAAVAAGIKVSGTGAQAAAAGVFQLSQALASGTLRGDELNSVLENIPAIGDAIARQMGVTTGELRKMGSTGKLSSEAVIAALEKAKPELERLAALIPLTFGGAFEKVKNAGSKLLTQIDKGNVGFGSALITGINLVSKALDALASHASAVANLMVGLFVASAVKAAAASIAAGAAVRVQAAANLVLAESAVAAAAAQHGQAVAALAVARTSGSLSMVGAGEAAANVTKSAKALGLARAEAAAAGTALNAAKASAGLFGRGLTAAATMGRAALALIGGPIGLVIAGLVAVGLWAGKAALSFKPIAGEAATVGDYVMEAFSQMGSWIGKVAGKIWMHMKEAMAAIGGIVRKAVVWYIDAWLGLGRAVAGIAGGIVAAFQEAMVQVGKMIAAMSKDAQAIMSGDWGSVGATIQVASAAPGAIGGAFSKGYSGASQGAFSGQSGEKIVGVMEALPGKIVSSIMGSDTVQGLRLGANERAAARARSEQGGGNNPGKPTVATPDGDKDKADKKKQEEKKKTFLDILNSAKEEARLAGLTSNEQEVQNALASARVDLERKLTEFEEWALTQEVKKKQENAANLALAQQTQAVIEETAAARVQSAAEEARMRGDYGTAAALEAELKVQQMLNQAKRDGVTLDAGKVEMYRAAVLLAAQEGELVKLQNEAKRALQEIADNARKAMQSAVSDGIYAALSGDFKVGDFFKTIGNILKKQLAESLTASLFGGQAKAQIDSLKATQAAIDITTPAAQAVSTATDNIVSAINAGAARIGAAANDNVAAPLEQAGTALAKELPGLQGGTSGWVQALTSSLGPLGGAIGSLISSIGGLVGGKKGADGRSLSLSDNSKLLKGAGIGSAAASLTGGSGIGGAVGGALGQKFIGSLLGKGLTTALGSFAGPLGSILGGVLGGVIGGLFSKKPSGTGTASNTGVTAQGNSSAVKTGIGSFGTSINAGVSKIAEALGAQVGAYSVGLGKYKDYFQVSSNANDSKLGQSNYNKKSSSALYDGLDEQEAIRTAILAALQQGAVQGIREGTQRLLKAGKDLDSSLQKALSFENVFKRLKQFKDPIGAAVDAVDAEFKNLKNIFKEAGASAADYASLEELYGLERTKAIKDATQSTTKVLQDFVAELRGGALGGASLSDRAAEQNRLFSAIEEAQKSGKAVDFDQLNSVGRALIDATRELEGATPAFYDQVNRVMGVLEAAIASGNNPNVSTLPAPLVFRDEVTTPVVSSIYDLNGNLVSGFDSMISAINSQTVALLRSSGQLAVSNDSGRMLNDTYQLANF